MAVDMFLELKNVKGESLDKEHKDLIDILAWSWGVSNSGTAHLGPGAGAGKANFQDISITKYVDLASPTLLKFASDGGHIEEGKLIVRKAGGKPLTYIVIEMKKIFITSFSTGGSGGEDRLTENVTLNFAKFKFTYTSQKPDGTKDKSPDFGYDIPAQDAKFG
jgi:type VI secretion system secreted protein Hcp